MTTSIQKSQAGQMALGSMSIRELLVELVSLEDDRAELADPAAAPDSGTAAALAADMSARERAIREELRQRRLALREHG